MSLWMRRLNSDFLYLEMLTDPSARELAILRVGLTYIERRQVIRYVVVVLGKSISEPVLDVLRSMIEGQHFFQGVMARLDEGATWPKWSKEWKSWLESRRARARLKEQEILMLSPERMREHFAELRCLERDYSWVEAFEKAESQRNQWLQAKSISSPETGNEKGSSSEAWDQDVKVLREASSSTNSPGKKREAA